MTTGSVGSKSRAAGIRTVLRTTSIESTPVALLRCCRSPSEQTNEVAANRSRLRSPAMSVGICASLSRSMRRDGCRTSRRSVARCSTSSRSNSMGAATQVGRQAFHRAHRTDSLYENEVGTGREGRSQCSVRSCVGERARGVLRIEIENAAHVSRDETARRFDAGRSDPNRNVGTPDPAQTRFVLPLLLGRAGIAGPDDEETMHLLVHGTEGLQEQPEALVCAADETFVVEGKVLRNEQCAGHAEDSDMADNTRRTFVTVSAMSGGP